MLETQAALEELLNALDNLDLLCTRATKETFANFTEYNTAYQQAVIRVGTARDRARDNLASL